MQDKHIDTKSLNKYILKVENDEWTFSAEVWDVINDLITTEQLAIWNKALEFVGEDERFASVDDNTPIVYRNRFRAELRSAIQQQIDSIKQEDKDNG